MFHNQLPKRWCIERNPRNFEEVNRLFGKMNGKTYRADGTWRTAGGSYRKRDYLCYPHYEGSKYRSKYQPSGYTEINLEQLKNYFMSKESKKTMDKLPETWYVVVTKDILLDAFRWRFGYQYKEENIEYITKNFKPGCIIGMYEWNKCGKHISKEWQYGNHHIDNGWGQEISEEDFRFHVLKKYNREDWIEGRIAILQPDVKDPLLNTFLKECNPKNSMLSYNDKISKIIYLVANMDKRVIEDHGKGLWKPFTTTDLPIVEDVKQLYANENIMKNTEKEVIGYELIRPEYKQVAMKALGLSSKDSYTPFIITGMISYYLPKIQELGIQEWFEPVYKPEIKLPLINGYNGVDDGDNIKYGCALLSKDWFTATSNRHIKEITLSSGIKITESQMVDIRNYLQSVEK